MFDLISITVPGFNRQGTVIFVFHTNPKQLSFNLFHNHQKNDMSKLCSRVFLWIPTSFCQTSIRRISSTEIHISTGSFLLLINWDKAYVLPQVPQVVYCNNNILFKCTLGLWIRVLLAPYIVSLAWQPILFYIFFQNVIGYGDILTYIDRLNGEMCGSPQIWQGKEQ